MQADAYAGFGRLYEANRKGGPIIEAACWAHGRRKFFDLARLTKAPSAAEAVKRIELHGKRYPASKDRCRAGVRVHASAMICRALSSEPQRSRKCC